MQHHAVVAGATGLVGSLLLRRLLADPRYDRVQVVARRSTGVVSGKLVERIVDFDRLTSDALAPPVDDVYCALGTTIRKAGSETAFRKVDFDHVVALARASLERGARRFLLVSALGADARSRVFYNRVKGEAERAVTALPFEAVHVFRPSLLLGDRRERRPGERAGIAVARALSPALLGPLRRYRPTPADLLAAAMIEAATSGARGVRIHEAEEIPRAAAGEGPAG